MKKIIGDWAGKLIWHEETAEERLIRGLRDADSEGKLKDKTDDELVQIAKLFTNEKS